MQRCARRRTSRSSEGTGRGSNKCPAPGDGWPAMVHSGRAMLEGRERMTHPMSLMRLLPLGRLAEPCTRRSRSNSDTVRRTSQHQKIPLFLTHTHTQTHTASNTQKPNTRRTGHRAAPCLARPSGPAAHRSRHPPAQPSVPANPTATVQPRPIPHL